MQLADWDGDAAAWNGFVERHGSASVFHLLEWREIISRAYGHESCYLAVRDGDRVLGLLPLFLIRSRVFGRALVSLPFADYGGICAAGDPSVARALLDEALRVGRRWGAAYLQLRQREPIPELPGTPADKVTMLLKLAADPDRTWRELPTERRNRVRKAARAGVSGRFVGGDGLDAFYGVFAENMRDLGSPVHSRAFFRAILDGLGSRASVLLVEHGGAVIGAALCLFFGGTIQIPWVSSLRRSFDLSPNMVLYWTAMEYGSRHGYQLLDFGRSSPGSNTYEFKRRWGASRLDLGWRSFPLGGGAVPTFDGHALKERLLVECWKRLPIKTSVWLGSRIRGLIPA